jgi:hypothetical protein
MLVGRVSDTFEIKGRGVVVATDTTYERLPRELRLKIGDRIELRSGGVVVLRTKVVGMEHCDPWTPQQTFGFLLPREVSRNSVPVGAEVWSVE